MPTVTNLNLASVNIFGNTGNVFQNVEPGIAKAVVLLPIGTVIPPSAMDSQAAFYAYVQSGNTQGFLADSRAKRYFAMIDLDDFKNVTKAMATVDTGLNQFEITKFNTKYTFRYIGNKANHQELLQFDNCQNLYTAAIIDSNGSLWGCKDPAGTGGVCGFSIQQLRIMDWSPADVKDFNQYNFSIQFKNRAEFNENFGIYAAGFDPGAIQMLLNAVMQDVTATLGTPLTITTTTDIVAIMKAGQGSIDMVKYYGSALTKDCFIAKDLTAGTTLTISTLNIGNIVAAGQSYFYLWFILSAAPTATHQVQVALRAPSVVNAIIPNFNAVTEIVQPGVDGSNACVHTF